MQLIYLDNNSTTQVDPRVIKEMLPYFEISYGNASSTHAHGLISSDAIKKSRIQIAELLDCAESEVYFTSGATESINFALKGIINQKPDKPKHIITVCTEHPAVIDSCQWLESKGVKVTYLSVKKDGLIDLDELESAITSDTFLICVMFVNNETGVIQPIKKIASIAHKNDILFMSDGTQAIGKIPISVYEYEIDILCFSGHKFYGPKGVGGIFIRSKRPFKPKIEAFFHGGGHEKGLRSGTLNVPGIVGMGKASEIAKNEMENDSSRIKQLRDKLETEMLKIPQSFINGNINNRIYSTANIRFDGVDADAIISTLKNIAISNGSACSAQSIEPSHVLTGMGMSETECFSSIRFSLGKFNTKTDILNTIRSFSVIIPKLRNFQRNYD